MYQCAVCNYNKLQMVVVGAPLIAADKVHAGNGKFIANVDCKQASNCCNNKVTSIFLVY